MNVTSGTLGGNIFTAPAMAMVGEGPMPFGNALCLHPITSTRIFGKYGDRTHPYLHRPYRLRILLDRFPGA